MYSLVDFNVNLFNQGHYVLKRYTKFKEAQSNQRLLEPYFEICSAFGLTQLINKPTRSTLKTLSHILTSSKESVTRHSAITLGLSAYNIIFCTREIKQFKSRRQQFQ